MDTVSVVKRVLETAIDQRGRPYQELFAVSVRFEADDTSADKDQQTFFNLVKCINIPLASNHPQSLVISTDDVHPGWTVAFFLDRLLDGISTSEGRSLLLFHYAGHGGLKSNGDVIFYAQVPGVRSFDYIRAIERTLVDPSHLTEPKLERTDVVIILDSCYSGSVIRSTPRAERTVELLAAVVADQRAFGNPSDLARIVNQTFTARLAREVAIGREREEKYLVLSDVIANLRSQSNIGRLPLVEKLVGSKAIRLPLKPLIGNEPVLSRLPRRGLESLESSESHKQSFLINAPPKLRVNFTVHIDRTLENNDLQSLVEWVRSLDSFLGLELTGVH